MVEASIYNNANTENRQYNSESNVCNWMTHRAIIKLSDIRTYNSTTHTHTKSLFLLSFWSQITAHSHI